MDTDTEVPSGPALMAAAAAEAARVVAGVPGHPMDAPTPCDDWDLRTLVTGQEYACDEAVAASVLATVEAQGELFRQYQGFAAIVPLPVGEEGATVLDRALSLSGRDPQWKPR